MSVIDSDGDTVDTDTGEIIPPDVLAQEPATAALVPTQVTHSTEVAVIPTSITELIAAFSKDEPTDLEVAQWVLEPDGMEADDPEESTRSILARILSAETAEEVLATQDVIHAQDILGEALIIDSVKWQRSDHQISSSCYAVLFGRRAVDQSKVVVTCGGRQVMMQALKLRMLGAFPQTCRIAKKSKATRQGYFPLFLELA